jgi:Short C-terminal domain
MMVDKFFKSLFVLVGIIAALFLLVTVFITMSMGGSSDWTPLAVVGAIIAFIIYRSTKRKKHKQAIERERQVAMDERIAGRSAQNDGIYERYDGHGAVIEMQKASMIITRHGLGSFLTQGIKGEKILPFHNITAVQFRDATRNMSGYIQFSLKGEVASGKGILDSTLDENTVMFTNLQSARFNELRNKIEAILVQPIQSGAVSPISFADELEKLANLKDRGVLTDAEFTAQKARLVA